MQEFFEYFVMYDKKYPKIIKKRGVFCMKNRTDMAFESHQRLTSGGKTVAGVHTQQQQEEGMTLRKLTVSTLDAARADRESSLVSVSRSANLRLGSPC